MHTEKNTQIHDCIQNSSCNVTNLVGRAQYKETKTHECEEGALYTVGIRQIPASTSSCYLLVITKEL